MARWASDPVHSWVCLPHALCLSLTPPKSNMLDTVLYYSHIVLFHWLFCITAMRKLDQRVLLKQIRILSECLGMHYVNEYSTVQLFKSL